MFYIFAPFRLIYKLYFGIVFFTTLLIQFPFYYVLTRNAKWAPAVIFMQRYIWSTLIQLLLLVWVVKIRKVKLKKGQSYVICPNHSSYHDIILSPRIMPQNFLFIGKAELKKWPLMQVFFKNGKFNIAINRKNPLEASRALSIAKIRIEEGLSMVIFPEGTISDTAPVLSKFKPGAFKLAIEAQVPIVPVTYLDNWALMSDPERLFGPCRPGISRVIMHDPIETKGMTEKDVVSLQKLAYELIEADLKKYVYPKLKKHGREN